MSATIRSAGFTYTRENGEALWTVECDACSSSLGFAPAADVGEWAADHACPSWSQRWHHRGPPMTAEPDIVDRLRSLGLMDDACDGCIPEECGDKMAATIANDAADEIERLRSSARCSTCGGEGVVSTWRGRALATCTDCGGSGAGSEGQHWEIEALRSIVRRQADRLEDCRRFVGSDRVSVTFHDHEFVAFLAAIEPEPPEEASEPNHDYRAARGVVDLGGIPAEQAIRRQRDGADQ